MNRREAGATTSRDRLPIAIGVGAVSAVALTFTPVLERLFGDTGGPAVLNVRYGGIALAYVVAIAAHFNRLRAGNRRASRRLQHHLSHLSLGAVMVGGAFLLTGWNKLGSAPKATTLTMVIAPALSLSWASLRQRSFELSVTAEPDTVVGGDIVTSITVRGPSASTVSFAMTSAHEPAWTDALAGDEGVVCYRAPRRGVFSHAAMALRCNGPLDLAYVQRNWLMELPRVVHVAPRPTEALDRYAAALLDELTANAHRHDDPMPAGVRPYQSGDQLRMVHWPATARSNEPMVRILEPTPAPEVSLIVHLGPHAGEVAEATASLAARVGAEVLARGLTLRLITDETDGPLWDNDRQPVVVDAPVRSTLDLGRRLARTVTGANLHPFNNAGRGLVVSPAGLARC